MRRSLREIHVFAGELQFTDLREWVSLKVPLPDDSVATEMIEDGAVTTEKLDDGAVTEPKLGTGAVSRAKLAAGAVGEDELGLEAVTGMKVAPGDCHGALAGLRCHPVEGQPAGGGHAAARRRGGD